MKKEYTNFINTWNYNIKNPNRFISSNEIEKHKQLFNYCIVEYKKAYKNIDLKEFILIINSNKKYEKEIVNNNLFKKCLFLKYHYENFNNELPHRKYIYKGQINNNEFEIEFERHIIIKGSSILSKKIFQKDIDSLIVDIYLKNLESMFDLGFDTNYKFLFYQISLYKKPIVRIENWIKSIKKRKNISQKKLIIITNFLRFFKKITKLNSEYERLEFWLNSTLNESKLSYYEDYFIKEDSEIYGENLINIFKKVRFSNLIKEFEKKRENLFILMSLENLKLKNSIT